MTVWCNSHWIRIPFKLAKQTIIHLVQILYKCTYTNAVGSTWEKQKIYTKVNVRATYKSLHKWFKFWTSRNTLLIHAIDKKCTSRLKIREKINKTWILNKNYLQVDAYSSNMFLEIWMNCMKYWFVYYHYIPKSLFHCNCMNTFIIHNMTQITINVLHSIGIK